jgi:hypothetical protein
MATSLAVPVLAIGTIFTTVTPEAPRIAAPERPPVTESVLRVPVEVPYALIERLVNEKAPVEVQGSRPDPTDLMYDDVLRYRVQRGAISVHQGPGCAEISMPIHGSATAHGRVGARGWLGRMVLSTSLQETAEFAGTVKGCVRFDVGPDWSVTPTVSLDLQLDRAEVRLIRDWIPVSFRTLATEEFNKRKGQIVSDVTAEIVTALDLKSKVQTAWASAAGVHTISTSPAAFAVVRPTRIVAEAPRFDSADAIHFGIGVVAQVEVVAGKKPAAPAAPTLPSLSTVAKLPSDSQLSIPVQVDLRVVNEELKKALGTAPIDVDDGKFIRIKGASIVADGAKAVLKLDVEGRRAWYLPDVRGVLYVTATPVWDAGSQTLALRKLDYTVATRNAFVNAVAWMAKPIALQVLESRARIDLSSSLEAARERANREIAALSREVLVGPAATVRSVRLTQVALQNQSLVVIATGELLSNVRLAALPK